MKSQSIDVLEITNEDLASIVGGLDLLSPSVYNLVERAAGEVTQAGITAAIKAGQGYVSPPNSGNAGNIQILIVDGRAVLVDEATARQAIPKP